MGDSKTISLAYSAPVAGTTPAGTFIKTAVALTGGSVNNVAHNIGVNPTEVTAFQTGGLIQIQPIAWDIVDVNTVAISVADSYANAVIKFIF